MALEQAEPTPMEREYANAVDMAAADPRKAMTRFEDLVLAGTRAAHRVPWATQHKLNINRRLFFPY